MKMKLIAMCWISALVFNVSAYCGDSTTNRSSEKCQLVQYGVASWYGDKEQGQPMACGEPFDENAMVAANRI